MRPVGVYDVVQPNLIVTGPTGTPFPGQGATEAVLGNPAAGFKPAVVAALGQPQGFPSPGTTAPDYGLLTGTGGGAGGAGGAAGTGGGGSGASGACGCG